MFDFERQYILDNINQGKKPFDGYQSRTITFNSNQPLSRDQILANLRSEMFNSIECDLNEY